MAKSKYILTHKIIGAAVMQAGHAIELTEDQAKHPFYRTRVRKADVDAELVPATTGNVPSEKERKGLIIARLKELKIEFDGRKNSDELSVLLPPGELEALFAPK